MSIKAGTDFTRYTQLQHPGERDERVLGTYPDSFSHMNIKNPQAGFAYAHVLKTRKNLENAVREGWEVIRKNDPESCEGPGTVDFAALGIDDSYAGGELVAMRRPLEIHRERVVRHEQLSRSRYDGAASGSDYLGKERPSGAASQKPVYVKFNEHGTTDVEGPGGL